MSRWRESRPLRRLVLACQLYLGRPVWAAVILLATAIGMLVHWLPMIRVERDQLRQSQRQQEDFVRSLSARATATGEVPPQPLTPLLPMPSQHHDDLGALLEIARSNGLSWQKAEYSMELGGTFGTPTNVLHLRLNLPVTGSALQVSRFLGRALNRLPHASVESLDFDREDSASPAQAANLHLVLLYRGSKP